MPDAPAPRYNSVGDVVGSWMVHIAYDEAADRLFVHAQTPGSRWTKSRSHRSGFDPDQVEDALALAARIVRTYGARRLF